MPISLGFYDEAAREAQLDLLQKCYKENRDPTFVLDLKRIASRPDIVLVPEERVLAALFSQHK